MPAPNHDGGDEHRSRNHCHRIRIEVINLAPPSGSQGNADAATSSGPVTNSPRPSFAADGDDRAPAPTFPSPDTCTVVSMSRLLRMFDAAWFVAEHNGADSFGMTVYGDRTPMAEEVARTWAISRHLPIETLDDPSSGRRTVTVLAPDGIREIFRVTFASHAARAVDRRSHDRELASQRRGRK